MVINLKCTMNMKFKETVVYVKSNISVCNGHKLEPCGTRETATFKLDSIHG